MIWKESIKFGMQEEKKITRKVFLEKKQTKQQQQKCPR